MTEELRSRLFGLIMRIWTLVILSPALFQPHRQTITTLWLGSFRPHFSMSYRHHES